MVSKGKGAGRRYTETKRQEILRDAVEKGVVEAARLHRVPEGTVSYWRWRFKGSGSATPSVRVPEDEAASSGLSGRQGATKGQETRRSSGDVGRGRRKRRHKAARRYTPSEKAQALEEVAEYGVAEASRRLGISRFTLYDWQEKLEKAAEGKGASPTSGPAPAEIEEQRDREILREWKKHPGLGPSQVRNQLRRRGIKVGLGTVRRVMEDAGYRPPKVKREPHDRRFEAVRPNHLWHLDFVHRHINRASTFTLILIDDYSRFVVGHGVDDAERADLVIRTFEEAVQRHGKPERVMHDRGAAFWSWRGISRFTDLLTELGIDQVVATQKEHNGKIEVFNANLHKEFFDRQRFYDVAEMRRRLATHLSWYDHARTHHALGGLLVPADRFYGRADEVLARIEAGAGRELGDDLDLRDRHLDLFKIVSHGGVTEVWLMGQRILTFPKKK